MAETKQLTPVQKLNNTTLSVQGKIDSYVKEGKLNIPQNYSVGNAIMQAQLKIQDDKKLMECTQASLAKCMLDMAVLGLNISKSQCYFVPFDGKAQIMVSYQGKVAIAKRIDPTIKDIYARCVKTGEEFEFEDDMDGNTIITKHKRTMESIKSKDILAAYACIVYNDGKPNKFLLMNYEAILKRWAKSLAKPFNADGTLKENSAHATFTEEMCYRTVISAICKPILNTSSDEDLFAETARAVDLEESKSHSQQKAEENMCSEEMIDVDFEDIGNETVQVNQTIDTETGEIKLDM